MMKTQSQADQISLVEECLEHMVSERTLLQRFVEHSKTINESLGKSVFPDDLAANQIEQQLAHEAETVAEKRANIKSEIALALNLPVSDATVRKFAESIPENLAAPLLEERELILKVHQQIAAISESNLMLLQQSIDIYHRVLQEVAGTSTRSQTYSSSGYYAPHSSVNLVSTEG